MSSGILQHFDVPEDVKSGKFKAKCKHCSTFISGHTDITSNFVTHMMKKHRDLYFTQVQKKADKEQPTISGFVKLEKGTSLQKYNNRDPRQQQITQAFVTFIAGDLMPLSIVDSENFKGMIQMLDPKYQVPCRKHLSSKLLHEKATQIRCDLKKQLRNTESVCLTIDLWSSRDMRGYLGITGHFLLDWAMQSVMICCKRFKGRHTSGNIRMEFEEVISCYEIGENIAAIVSDNASNMVKAFSLPGCETLESPCQDIAENSSDEDTDFQETSEQKPEPVGAECLPKHSRCFAHTLQLVVKDGLKEVGGHLRTALAKASKIVNFVRKSIHASEVLEDNKRLQAANATHWNSQLTMIKSVLNIPEKG